MRAHSSKPCLWIDGDASPGSAHPASLRVCMMPNTCDALAFYAYYYPYRLEGGVALRRRGG
jgi:hypothetical protein